MLRTTVLCAIALLLLSTTLAQDALFTVTRPDPGDTLVLSSSPVLNDLYIDWTVVPGTEDDPVLITLQRGEDVESLETIETVNGIAHCQNTVWPGTDRQR